MGVGGFSLALIPSDGRPERNLDNRGPPTIWFCSEAIVLQKKEMICKRAAPVDAKLRTNPMRVLGWGRTDSRVVASLYAIPEDAITATLI